MSGSSRTLKVRLKADTTTLVFVSLLVFLGSSRTASAQIDGSVSVMTDVLPDTSSAPGTQTSTELRTRLFLERIDNFGDHVRTRLSGYVDTLLADRKGSSAKDAIVRPQDLYVELHGSRADVRVGFSRLVWGRLDEFQPTDVVNPLDLSRFLLEGRSEARLAVAMIRGRVFLPGGATVEGVLVPAFRSGRFDQLDEPSSPFNLLADAVPPGVPIDRRDPDVAWKNLQGGARTTLTAGRVDIGASVYRGFRGFSLLSLESTGVVETFPRFTMLGADFETVRGAWGLRGELAAFVDDALQSPTGGPPIDRATAEGGIGVDRRAGDYRLAANLLWSHRDEDDLSVVVAADRSFARETKTLRIFGIYNPADGTAFGRAIVSASLRDNVSLEGSGGIFTGTSTDTIGQLSRRDFLYARLKIFF